MRNTLTIGRKSVQWKHTKAKIKDYTVDKWFQKIQTILKFDRSRDQRQGSQFFLGKWILWNQLYRICNFHDRRNQRRETKLNKSSHMLESEPTRKRVQGSEFFMKNGFLEMNYIAFSILSLVKTRRRIPSKLRKVILRMVTSSLPRHPWLCHETIRIRTHKLCVVNTANHCLPKSSLASSAYQSPLPTSSIIRH